jgi:hypothetical protein
LDPSKTFDNYVLTLPKVSETIFKEPEVKVNLLQKSIDIIAELAITDHSSKGTLFHQVTII